jgi:hypothetical protein
VESGIGGITWNNQPAFGAVLDTQTLASGAVNLWYNWDVTPFVQQKLGGNKLVSLVVKPVAEGSTDTTGPSYAFDAKEFGSNAPVLQVATGSSGATVGDLRYFYRYAPDNATWGSWTQVSAPVTTAPYSTAFGFNGYGYYEFYSIVTDNLGNAEPAPAAAQASVRYQAASGNPQTLSFGPLSSPVQLGGTFLVSATASSGMRVSFSSRSMSVCTVSSAVVTTIAPGTCTIAADQLGDVGYWQPAATVTQSFSVTAPLIAQTITFPQIGGKAYPAAPFGATASATSGLTVSIVSQTPAVCSFSNGNVSLLAVGTCTLAAVQPGDAVYAPASTLIQSFSVSTAVVDSGSDGDVPLPAWALVMLGAGLLGTMRRFQRSP